MPTHEVEIYGRPLAKTPSRNRVYVAAGKPSEKRWYGRDDFYYWLTYEQWWESVGRDPSYYLEFLRAPVKKPRLTTIIKYVLNGERKFAWKLFKDRYRKPDES